MDAEPSETPTWSSQPPPHPELVLTELCRRQHGVVHLDQLRSIGLSGSAARSRAAVGRLRRLHRGVYAVRGTLLPRGLAMAAVLACGDGTVVSHRSAAYLHGLVAAAPSRPHVTNSAGTGRRRPGLCVHAVVLSEVDRGLIDGIPVTSLARTLLGLAAVEPDIDRLRRVIVRAETLRRFDLDAVRSLLERTAGDRGHARLTEAVGLPPIATVNELEDAMSRICARARVPSPLINHWIVLADGSRFRLDFFWPEHRLAIETGGNATHGTRLATAADRARDRRLRLETGIETYRFTYWEVMNEPALVARQIRGFLNR